MNGYATGGAISTKGNSFFFHFLSFIMFFFLLYVTNDRHTWHFNNKGNDCYTLLIVIFFGCGIDLGCLIWHLYLLFLLSCWDRIGMFTWHTVSLILLHLYIKAWSTHASYHHCPFSKSHSSPATIWIADFRYILHFLEFIFSLPNCWYELSFIIVQKLIILSCPFCS